MTETRGTPTAETSSPPDAGAALAAAATQAVQPGPVRFVGLASSPPDESLSSCHGCAGRRIATSAVGRSAALPAGCAMAVDPWKTSEETGNSRKKKSTRAAYGAKCFNSLDILLGPE